MDDNDEYKSQKGKKVCQLVWKIKFEDYRNHIESNQLEKEINHQEKNNFDVDGLRKNHEEFVKYNR